MRPTVRVIGDPSTLVSHVGVTAHNLREMHPVLLRTDVVVVGETEEFDVFQYVRDAISLVLPRPNGLIIISHERFEEAGMELLPAWPAPLVPEVCVEFMSAGNPYWVPGAPSLWLRAARSTFRQYRLSGAGVPSATSSVRRRRAARHYTSRLQRQ